MNKLSMNSPQSEHARTAIEVAGCPALDVAVIVPTFNRAASLARLLDSLCAQHVEDVHYEVLIVDNGSTDRTLDIAAAYAATFPFVHCLSEARAGASNARNRGILSTHARILAFIDDDVVAAPDWIDGIVRTFDRHPGDRLPGRTSRAALAAQSAAMAHPGALWAARVADGARHGALHRRVARGRLPCDREFRLS